MLCLGCAAASDSTGHEGGVLKNMGLMLALMQADLRAELAGLARSLACRGLHEHESDWIRHRKRRCLHGFVLP